MRVSDWLKKPIKKAAVRKGLIFFGLFTFTWNIVLLPVSGAFGVVLPAIPLDDTVKLLLMSFIG